jgi:hypothetical protein
MLVPACLVAASGTFQRPDTALCRGRLGAGLPLPFVCDASGESPLSSVGRIDWADTDSVNLLGAPIDMLFYALLLSGLWGLWGRARSQAALRR